MTNQKKDFSTENQKKRILAHVDHTLLKAVADWTGIRSLCEEAVSHGTASVCIPPSYVERVHRVYPDLAICTVVGFHLGYHTTETKVFEAKQALDKGASEIDMVVNLGHVKNGDMEEVTKEIRTMKGICGNHILKVIIETCYLTEDEKIALCRCVTEGGADYIKTSTGFGSGGATEDDVRLMKKHIGQNVKIKAAGGIRTKEELEKYLALGCKRIGASNAVAALTDENDLEN